MKDIAKKLFNEMTRDRVKYNIDEIRLIRATNESANEFYESFKGVKMLEVPFFIHYLHNPAE